MLQSCILKIAIFKKNTTNNSKNPKCFPLPTLQKTFSLSAFPFSFLIHSLPTGLCRGGYEDAQAETLCLHSSVNLGWLLSPVWAWQRKKVTLWQTWVWPSKTATGPSVTAGSPLLLHGKCEAAYPMSTDKLFYVYLRVEEWVYGVIAAWLTHGIATSWLPCR